jgi:hypothetical protein
VLIIHCPSDTLDFYKETPQRKLAQAAPVAEAKVPLQRWCRIDPEREGALPIDDSNGGCDCTPYCKNYKAWSRQIAALTIAEGDAVTDSAEAYNLMQQRGIENVIVMGVHTNICVLGRPFSIRQLVYQGKNVVLMRDLTDTMYDPRKAPFVSHFTGTDLVVEHFPRAFDFEIEGDFGLDRLTDRGDRSPHVAAAVAPEYQCPDCRRGCRPENDLLHHEHVVLLKLNERKGIDWSGVDADARTIDSRSDSHAGRRS